MTNESILISMKPEWVEKIIKGEKTIEVRKIKPHMSAPFRVYVYCSLTGRELWLAGIKGGRESVKLNGKVCLEFVCHRVDTIGYDHAGLCFRNTMNIYDTAHVAIHPEVLGRTCLTEEQIRKYIGGCGGYGWHISDMKVYDHPLMIEDFQYYGCRNHLSKAPQSIVYVGRPEKLADVTDF